MKKNGFVPIIIILIIAIFGAIGYFIYPRKVINKPEVTKIQNVPVSSSTTSTSSALVTNWKTYTNKTKGYSLNYPDDWFVSADDSDQTTLANFPTNNPNKDKEN